MMVKRVIAVLPALLLAALVAGQGCSPSTELSGTPIPNAVPDTRLTGTPPNLRESDFVVRFFWSGSDPDGRVAGYQWKLSDNGTDGIGLSDTLTIDPATGDTINPWRFTVATDTTLIVRADLNEFPPDSNLTDPRDRRAYQTHTLFVRAVDEDGAVDPTPALVSFTATTLVPYIVVDRPASLTSYRTVQAAPPTVTFGWTGSDPDFDLGVPVRVRYLWKRATLPDGSYCDSEYIYNQNVERLVSFSDSAWSDWIPYDSDAEARTVTFPSQPIRDTSGRVINYLFAIQAEDTAGARSVERTYARNVHNVRISANLTPLVTVRERYLGSYFNTSIYGSRTYDIAQNQPLDFSWVGVADSYAGSIVAYRYGWDVADSSDENDPGWAVQPGNTALHRSAPVRAFQTGTHTLTIQCWDNSGQLTRITIVLFVVPVPQLADQAPVLLLDDVKDRDSQAWVGSDGVFYDNDRYRDTFWAEALAGPGGVADFDSSTNVLETETYSRFGYRDVVGYRSIVWAHKKALTSYVGTNFDPSTGVGEKYVWLTIYQQQIGNVFFTGQQALQSFVGDKGMVLPTSPSGANWMTPIVFDTPETYYTFNNERFALGFGTRRDPNGTDVLIGTERYPYLVWGVGSIDQTSHNYYVYPGVPGRASQARKSNCVGMKAAVLDPAFKQAYVDPGALPDTLWTRRLINYADHTGSYPTVPRLTDPFQWSLDEFYDQQPGSYTTLSTPVVPQRLPDGRFAIEPMWRYYGRFDWIDDLHASRGDPGWPGNVYSVEILRGICGSYALSLSGRVRFANADVGFLSHKTELTKRTGRPDVLWGFDPSRMEHGPAIRSVRWVLSEIFGLNMTNP